MVPYGRISRIRRRAYGAAGTVPSLFEMARLTRGGRLIWWGEGGISPGRQRKAHGTAAVQDRS